MKNKKLIWIINQYANIPEFPGHTRQYEISLGLAKKIGKLRFLLPTSILVKENSKD